MADVEKYDDLLIFGQTVFIIIDLINNLLKILENPATLFETANNFSKIKNLHDLSTKKI